MNAERVGVRAVFVSNGSHFAIDTHVFASSANNRTGRWLADCEQAIVFFVMAYAQDADLTLRQVENGREHAFLPLDVPTIAGGANLGHRAQEGSVRLTVFRHRRHESGDVTRITRWIEVEFSEFNIITRNLSQCDDRNLWTATCKTNKAEDREAVNGPVLDQPMHRHSLVSRTSLA